MNPSATPPPEPATNARTRRRSGLRVVLVTLVLLAAGSAAGTLYLANLWRGVPEHWANHVAARKTQDATEVRKMSRRIERRVINQLGARYRPGNERRFEISTDELNAWLRQRMRPWASNRNLTIPHFIKEVMVATQAQQIILAVHVQSPDFSQIISARYEPQLRDDGLMQLRLVSSRAGNMPLPLSLARDELAKRLNPEHQALLARFEGVLVDGEPFEPLLPTTNANQRLRVTMLEVSSDGIVMEYVAEPVEN